MISTLILASVVSFKSVSPTVCQAPCQITTIFQVPPDEKNATVVLELESENFYRRVDMDFRVFRPKTTQIAIPDVPSGETEVRIEVYGFDGKLRGIDTRHVKVIGWEEDKLKKKPSDKSKP